MEPLVPQLTSGGCVLGDKGFDCIRLLEATTNRNCVPIIAIKEGSNFQIKDPLRLLSKKNADSAVYKKRALIEGLFGNTKQKLTSHVRIFSQEIAKIFALLRFALFNMATLVAFEKAKIWIWFSDSAIVNDVLPALPPVVRGFLVFRKNGYILATTVSTRLRVSTIHPRITAATSIHNATSMRGFL